LTLNAVAESFFATLKKELVNRRPWPTKAELRSEIFDYIEIFYNRQRRHGTLGMRSPAEFENSTLGPGGADLAASRLASPQTIRFTAPTTGKVCEQIIRRVAGKKITDRLVSMTDPDARPIRKGKLRAPTEFGTVIQVTEICENTRRGARGLILPASTEIGSPNESNLLPSTGARLDELDITPREIALDGGFQPGPVAENLPPPDRLFIAGRKSAGSRKTNRRLAKFRVGCEGRISHLKRRYGLGRSRLKGHDGTKTRAAWAIQAYNLDTLAIRTP
jgi:hypothetical protein